MSAQSELDVAIPARDTAWDAHAMKVHFENTLRTRSGNAVVLDDCRIERFRYRYGKRVVALYELRRRDAANAQTDWVTGVLYPGSKSKRLRTELQAQAENCTSGDAGSLYPAAYVEELGMALQVYPLDRQLGAMADIVANPDGLISRACKRTTASGIHDSDAHWSAALARYRPLQSATFAYTTAHDGLEDRVYVKAYRKGECEAPRERWQALGTALRSGAGISAPKLLGHDAQTNTLVLEKAEGTSLLELIREGLSPKRAGTLAATALAQLHRSSDIPTVGNWKPTDVLETAARAVAFLSWAAPGQSDRLQAIEEAIHAAADSGLRAATHLDVKVDHLFFDEDRPGMIDLDTMDLADPIIDVATLAARLEYLHLTEPISVDDCKKAAHAFVDAYSSLAGGLPVSAFRSHYANTVLQLALFATRHQREGWNDTVTRLLSRAASGAAVYGQ
jgi:hypothetical protein